MLDQPHLNLATCSGPARDPARQRTADRPGRHQLQGLGLAQADTTGRYGRAFEHIVGVRGSITSRSFPGQGGARSPHRPRGPARPGWPELETLIGAALWNLVSYLLPQLVALPGLTPRQAAIESHTSTAVGNLLP